MPKQTPSQTVGPFFTYGLTPEPYGHRGIASNVLATDKTKGTRIRIEGTVFDGAGAPVTDAVVEIWQADAAGRYPHPADSRAEPKADDRFSGFGRVATDGSGRFSFDTIKPGRVPGRGNSLQAPHIGLIVLARGMLNHVFSRLYFADEATANAEDPVLGTVDPARRGTLIAQRQPGSGTAVYRLDIRLQGPGETVFFDA
jgi:protocatechuate 3,4-dioxygenase alpha subunit